MTIKAIYDSLDDIPEEVNFRDLFVEKDGKFELTGIDGVKTSADVSRLQAALTKEKNDHKAAKSALSVWGDLDHDEIQQKLDSIPELEAAAKDKLDEHKIEEMVQRRVDGTIKSKTSPLERELTKLRKERDDLKEENGSMRSTIDNRSMEDLLRPVMREKKILGEHEEDVFMYAQRHLEKTEDGGFVVRDGVNGLTPGADPKDWLEEMVAKRPGWLPPTQGAGSRGSGSGGGLAGAGNPWTNEGWNKTKQGLFLREHGSEKANAAAKAAGTTLHGPRPKPKS